MPIVEDVKVCSGAVIARGDAVSLLYRVALSREQLLRGDTLESTYSPEIPIEVRVEPGELLPGVLDGLVGMRASGSVRLLGLAAEEAFGTEGYRNVPPGSELWVEICAVQLIRVGGTRQDTGTTA